MKKNHPAVLLAVLLLVLALSVPGDAREDRRIMVLNLAGQEDVPPGKPFLAYAETRGWTSPLGDPVYFFIRDGKLHLVSRPGPVYNSRYWLAIFNRDKLKDRIENKVLMRITPATFRIDPQTYPLLGFAMTPEKLPSPAADLRDSGKNDAAFYLIVAFDTRRHDFMGYEMPESIAYVWANRRWEKPVAVDPDYDAFMRYIAIGWGSGQLGKTAGCASRRRQGFSEGLPGAPKRPGYHRHQPHDRQQHPGRDRRVHAVARLV